MYVFHKFNYEIVSNSEMKNNYEFHSATIIVQQNYSFFNQQNNIISQSVCMYFYMKRLAISLPQMWHIFRSEAPLLITLSVSE